MKPSVESISKNIDRGKYCRTEKNDRCIYRIKKKIKRKESMKGIILAGGTGTRLYPLTLATSKHLLPVYDKPMIYYPLSTLMLAGIKEILIITTPEDKPKYESMLGDGCQFGICLSYAVQEEPRGIAQGFAIAEEFINEEECAMILGDNLFYGGGLSGMLQNAVQNAKEGNATVFGYYVNAPERFGIIEFNDDWSVLSVEEKPEHPRSNYCITGLYFYPQGVVGKAKKIMPSDRGELEITALNEQYLEEGKLKAQILGRGFVWRDVGTMDSLLDAAVFVQMIEKQQGVLISAPEEIAFRKGWITKDDLLQAAEKYGKSTYGRHLKQVADGLLRY